MFFRLDDNLSQAVEDCLKAAGIVHDPEHQKTLMKAAQFGTAFCKINTPNSSQWVINALKRNKIIISKLLLKLRATKI